MEASSIAGAALLGLLLGLAIWLPWHLRRDLLAYRRWRGGTWACVAGRLHLGVDPALWWLPASEVREGQHVVEWETWPGRTRVRGRGAS